jgi:hypothetical protein
MFTVEQHLDNLIRHIELVRGAGIILGRRLIAQGRVNFGRILIAKVHAHDQSKFYGIEWQLLHMGPDIPMTNLEPAIKQHRETNSHHPEYWGGFESMPEIAVAEMVCDWYARATEFGTGLREWILTVAVQKFEIDIKGERFRWVQDFLNLLLQDTFSRQ